MNEPTLPNGTTFGGRWVIERPLSSGGMGTVYVAKHKETGRPVALKVIKLGPQASEELISRFKRETGALAAVSHPNVVTFLDSGLDDTHGQLFLVMELLKGRPLRDVMNEPVEPTRAMRICADVCRALAAVHEKGIVHRDLKPENVFLVDAVGHDEIAKLIDFGIVRLEEGAPREGRTATMTGAVIGTPGYISPEQLQGHMATFASDVYAVGVIFYELVTGKFPFEAPSTHAMLVKQLIEPLPPPRQALPTLPHHVEQLILRFMEREPARRVRTAQEALALLVENAKLSTSLPPNAATEMAVQAVQAAAIAQQVGGGAGVPPANVEPRASRSAESVAGFGVATATATATATAATANASGAVSPARATSITPPATKVPIGAPADVAAKSKLVPMVGGGAAALLLVVVIAVLALGGDDNGKGKNAKTDGSDAVAAVGANGAPGGSGTGGAGGAGAGGAGGAGGAAANNATANANSDNANANNANANANANASGTGNASASTNTSGANSSDDDDDAKFGARRAFIGTFNGSFRGEARGIGANEPRIEQGSSLARITPRKGGGLNLRFGESTCITELAVRNGKAVFAPTFQMCTIPARGGKRTNRSTGTITVVDGGLRLVVEGTFTFKPDRGEAVQGTFKHDWRLQRQ